MSTIYLFFPQSSLLIPYNKSKITLGFQRDSDFIFENTNYSAILEYSKIDDSWTLRESNLERKIGSADKFWIGTQEIIFFSSWEDYSRHQQTTVKINHPKQQIATETLRIVPPAPSNSSFHQKIPNFLILCLVVINSYIIFVPDEKILPQINWDTTTPSFFGKIKNKQQHSTLKKEFLWHEVDSWPILLLSKNELVQKQEQMIKCFEEKRYSQALQIYEESIYPKIYQKAKSLENIAQYNRWLFHFLELYQANKNSDQLDQNLKALDSQIKLHLKSADSQQPFLKLIQRIRKLVRNRR